jgi:crossover junction endodeoxyribonuclease RuvC
VGDYNPMQVKKAVSGYGWADKTQVGKMVMVILNLKTALPADAADAAAVAIGHLLSTRRP